MSITRGVSVEGWLPFGGFFGRKKFRGHGSVGSSAHRNRNKSKPEASCAKATVGLLYLTSKLRLTLAFRLAYKLASRSRLQNSKTPRAGMEEDQQKKGEDKRTEENRREVKIRNGALRSGVGSAACNGSWSEHSAPPLQPFGLQIDPPHDW